MRKILPLIMVGILVLGGLGAVAGTESEESERETISVSFSQPIVEYENEYVSINIDETNTFLMEDGKPMLPSYIHTFSFPFGTKIKKVTCELSYLQEKTLSKHIKPTPKAFAVGSLNVRNEEKTINYGIEPYPSEWFNYDLGCGRNGKDLNVFVKAEVFPVKYYPAEKRIKWATNAEIKIEYQLPGEPITFDEEYSFIVLAPNEFSDELAPLVTHKISRGISTKFVSLSDIYNGVYFPATGRDDPEEIKYFIKNAIENWGTIYVLLVGSWDENSPSYQKFPVRETHVHIYFEEDPDDANEIFLSDLYYADIYNETGAFLSWDSNNNNIFGEFDWGESNNFDEVDLYPDVYLGRLACVNGNEVTTCVNKIKKYEKIGQEAYRQDWFTDIVYIGGDTWPGDSRAILEGEYIQEKIQEVMTVFTPDYINVTNGRLGTLVPPFGVGDITNTINKGCGFLEWSGHGNLNVWATHPHEDETKWIPTPSGYYLNTKVQRLSNGDELPIVIVGGCSCGKYNKDRDCFAWSFVMNSDGGGIAVMAASGLLYSADGKATVTRSAGLIEINTFKAYRDMGAITFGEMWALGINEYINMRHLKLRRSYCTDYKTMEQWQSFGDPTLAIGEESEPPLTPSSPDGPTSGVPGTAYSYTAVTTDPEDDEIYYRFDWGDGKVSNWLGPKPSGESITASHTWSPEGEYEIKVIAKDSHGKLSEWSDPLIVTMPRSRTLGPDTDGTFTAEMGRRGSSDPEIYLDGNYKNRGRYKIIWGTATAEEKEGRFRGVFFGKHFIIRVPTPRITIHILGRCSFDENDFSGQWISRTPYTRGWIEGEFTTE